MSSTVNVYNFILQLQEKINLSSDEKEIFYLSKAVQLLEMGSIYNVESFSELPDPSENEGNLFFVVSDNQLYYPVFQNIIGFYWKQVYVTEARTISSWGTGTCGALGNYSTGNSYKAVNESCTSTNWCQVSAGCLTSSALKTDGTLWAWGSGGRLGDGTNVSRCVPVQESTKDDTWCYVSLGCVHGMAIKTGGTLWAWGYGGAGRLGNNCSSGTFTAPTQEISNDTTWNTASSGFSTSLAIKNDGTMWAWGCNVNGRLGDGTDVDKCSPVQEVSSNTNWCLVTTSIHGSAIKTDGTLWSWGSGSSGALGNGSLATQCSPVQEFCSDTTWCQVSSSVCTSVAIKTGGTLWAWGNNLCGRLGTGDTSSTCSPVQEFYSDTIWCQVSTSCLHSAAVKTDGTSWSWGNATAGRLGDGTTVDRCSPVQEFYSSTNWCQVSTGVSHTAAISIKDFGV